MNPSRDGMRLSTQRRTLSRASPKSKGPLSYGLALLCPYFSSYLPCVALFYFRLPCCTLIFLRTYPAVAFFAPAVRLFYFRLPCCAIILFSLTLCHGLGPSVIAWSSPQAGTFIKARRIDRQRLEGLITDG